MSRTAGSAVAPRSGWIACASTPEVADEAVIRSRPKVSKEFTDKLNPCYRWLASQCGRPWRKVYSELTAKFDTRNLASWHIVNQHMLTDIQGAGTPRDSNVFFANFQRFFVDAQGILRDRGKSHWRNRKPVHTGPSRESALAHARGHKVKDILVDNLWWALPNGPAEWRACTMPHRCSIAKHFHRVVDVTPAALVAFYSLPGNIALGEGGWWRKYAREHVVTETWTIKVKLSKAEIRWWESLSYSIRSELRVPRD